MFGFKAKAYLLDVPKHTHIYFIWKAFFVEKLSMLQISSVLMVVCGVCPVRFSPSIGVYRT